MFPTAVYITPPTEGFLFGFGSGARGSRRSKKNLKIGLAVWTQYRGVAVIQPSFDGKDRAYALRCVARIKMSHSARTHAWSYARQCSLRVMCIVRQCSVMSDAHQCYFSYDFLVIVTVIVTHFLSF